MKSSKEPAVAEPSAAHPYRVAVVDDHAIMRAVFGAIVEDSPSMELAWCAPDLTLARSLMAQEVPDLLILDVSLPDGNGFDFTKEILVKNKGLPVLIISAEEDESSIQRAAAAGARGFLTKDVSADHVLARIRTLLMGEQDAGRKPPSRA